MSNPDDLKAIRQTLGAIYKIIVWLIIIATIVFVAWLVIDHIQSINNLSDKLE